MSEAAAAFEAYRRAFNRVVCGNEEPTAEQFGRWFDQRYGLWLPPHLLKRRRSST